MFILPIIAGAIVGADLAEPGIVEAKINDFKQSFVTEEGYIETCHLAPSVHDKDVMICLQQDGSYIVRDK